MEISLLNERIVIQKVKTEIDEVGNHINSWTDCFSCMATVSGEGGTETFDAGNTADTSNASFTVRWCSETSGVLPTTHRIVFDGSVFNILSVDHLSYKKQAVKFICEKERAENV